MNIVSKRALRDFWENEYPDARVPMETWHDVVKGVMWTSHDEVKQTFGKRVDLAHGLYVFDVGGNKYRIVCRIMFEKALVYIRWVGDHANYDRLNKRNGLGPKSGLGMKDL